jgi:lysyl endopeptidase
MRRKTAIVIGACAALVLAGTAGAATWNFQNDEGRTVGTWHEGPKVAARSGVGIPEPAAQVKGPAKPPERSPEPTATSTKRPETAIAPAVAGRQDVGRLLPTNKPIGYGAEPQRQSFVYPGATYVKLHFDRMSLRPGDYLTVSNQDGTETHRYDAVPTTDEWAMSVTGDTAELRLHQTNQSPDLSSSGLGATVDKVARGFSRTEQATVPEVQLTAPGHDPREESVCGGDESADAVCYKSTDPVAYTRSLAIARLLINGTELCTGWRVGPHNRLLTNNHCFDKTAAATDTEVWFNYQCKVCKGKDPYQPIKVWGAQVLATDHVFDFTLFTVADFAAIQKFGYLTLDTVRPVKGQELYVPQHPAGEPTRIAGALGDHASTCAVSDNAYNGYAARSDVAYYCDTAGGSSGSPVLSRTTNKVVALHHFGGCPNSGVRADLLNIKLKTLL